MWLVLWQVPSVLTSGWIEGIQRAQKAKAKAMGATRLIPNFQISKAAGSSIDEKTLRITTVADQVLTVVAHMHVQTA